MSTLAANIVGLVLIPILAVLVLGPYWLIWGGVDFLNGVLGLFRPALVLSVLIVSVVIHEALHGVGFIWIGRQPRQAVRFGFQWKTLTPYAHCKSALPASAYRWAIFLPGLVLGLIPALVGISFGVVWLSLYGAIMLIAAGGDLMILWLIRSIPSTALIIDHPTRVGCWAIIE